MVEMKLLAEKCLQSVSWDDFHFQQHLQVQRLATMQGKTPTYNGWMYDMFRRSDPKVGCVFPVVEVSLLPHEEFGSTDHLEDDQHFSWEIALIFT